MFRHICNLLLTIALLWPGVSWATFTVVQNKEANDGGSAGTTLNVVFTSNVTAGNGVACYTRSEGSPTTLTASGAGGGSWVNKTIQNNGNGDMSDNFSYVLSATGGNATVTLTAGASVSYKAILCWEFAHDGTAAFDADNVGTGSSGNGSTSNITTTDSVSVLVFGGATNWDWADPTSPTINGVAATGSLSGGYSVSSLLFYRILSSTMTGNAAANFASGPWNMRIIAFRESAGGAVAVPKMMLLGVGP